MLIAIHGFKQSGKDTLADLLVSEYGFKKIAFADKVKEVLHLLFGVPKEHLWGSDEDKQKLTKVAWDHLEGIDKEARRRNLFKCSRVDADFCHRSLPIQNTRYLVSVPKCRPHLEKWSCLTCVLKMKPIISKVSKKRPSSRSNAPALVVENTNRKLGLADENMDHLLNNDSDLEAFFARGRELFSNGLQS